MQKLLPAIAASVSICICFLWPNASLCASSQNIQNFFSLSLEELLDIPISSATLIPTSLGESPSSLSLVSQHEIQLSGARRLNEVFDILVPGAQIRLHHYEFPHLGIRGIMSDRDDKYLLLVNRRVMNLRTTSGAVSERILPMMGDIEKVEFVRGPASATYGPGAISGAVNLITYNANTFTGTEATLRGGVVEEYLMAELKHTIPFQRGGGVFLYYGVADYTGASPDDAPYVYGRSFEATGGFQVVAGEPAPHPEPNHRATYNGELMHKLHAEVNYGPLDIWLRFTKGSEQMPFSAEYAQPTAFSDKGRLYTWDELRGFTMAFHQITLTADYTTEILPDLDLTIRASYDTQDYQRHHGRIPQPGYHTVNVREDEYYAKAQLTWIPSSRDSLALGLEYSHERFGEAGRFGPDDYPASMLLLKPVEEPWTTRTASIFTEYQRDFTDSLTGYASFRVDKHTYSDWLFSPRLALVWRPHEDTYIKLIMAEANRRPGDEELRYEHLTTGDKGREEELRYVEARIEHSLNKQTWLAFSAFRQRHKAVSFTTFLTPDEVSTGRSIPAGSFRIYGLEAEMIFSIGQLRVNLSHNYTTLESATLRDYTQTQLITAHPYGYGKHLADWSSHSTKIFATCEALENLDLTASLVVYWGFPGAEDMAKYNGALPKPMLWVGLIDEGYDEAFGSSWFLNLGAHYEVTKNLDIQLNLHNVLGWVDEEYNKRGFIAIGSDYRSLPPSASLTLRWRF